MNKRSYLLLVALTALLSAPAKSPASELTPVVADGISEEAARHKATVEERMTDYFQYEYTVSPGKVTSAKATVIEILPVQGWPHRFRSTGKAYVETFDARRRTSSRISVKFEVETEEKSSGAIKVERLTVT